MTSKYQRLVSSYLQSLRARGMSNQQIAHELEIGEKRPSYIAMLFTMTTALAPEHLPRFSEVCRLSAYQRAGLALAWAKDHGIGKDALRWILVSFTQAKLARRASS